MFNTNEPATTVTMTEKVVWDCPNAKATFYEAKHNTLTIINNKINWCMAEIERLKSLEISTPWELERYATEMKYLQTTVSDCMLSFFYDLEAFIDMKSDIESNIQMAVQWTGDKFTQRLFYNIFEKLNLDYSLDSVRNIMFYKPKLHKVRVFDMVKSLVRAVELLTEENKELRQEIKGLRNNYGYCTQLTNEQKEELEMAWKDFKEGR